MEQCSPSLHRPTHRVTQRMSGEGKVVCVTGGSGYIASWLVNFLLQKGYTVNATVRDPSDSKKTDHLLALDGAKERLNLFKADLLEEGSFDSAIDGCEGVFHAASPVLYSAELVDPAVKGTLNVLKSCIKFQSIKRVVITSSMAAVLYGRKSLTPDVVVDETWHSDLAVCKEMKLWYMVAKTLAEEVAWNFAEENGIDLVTIHPAYVIGPLLQPTLNFSVEMILNIVNGAETYPDAYYRSTDVRDVAEAHIQAFEVPSACGRYCLVANVLHFSEVLKIVHEHFPSLHLPAKCDDKNHPFLPHFKVSKEKAKTLGINFIPLEVTLKDTIESLKEKDFLSI
ncbi:hypothetical protein MANES_10G138800v8 [Manihot esculenta]|uniref:Uncharacterized protein n=1 Tax=Manihot esculenta TaxID=3983 RepID=A0ACB7H228_MANES|nr:hypothetical protein MANES_10G138800v8 [Manihot esculenta]